MKTEIGEVQAAVREAADDEEKTPLQQKLDDFGNLLAKVIFIICAVVWLINYSHFFDPVHGSVFRGCIYYFKIAVALAVAAIPEGLPAVITTCLALGTRKMAKRNCIVRKLPSVETLGCTTVICSDKTGTLTTNEMVGVKFVVPASSSDVKEYEVEGHNYAPVGKISGLKSIGKSDVGLATFAKVAVLCNESRLTVDESDGRFYRTGEPTEAALRVLAEKMGCPDETLNRKILQKDSRPNALAQGFSDYWAKDFTRHALLEFTRDRKSMSVIGKNAGSRDNVLYVKGAPESVLERCEHVMLPDGSVVNAYA
jgi:Ca2+-transporting ATPase